LKTPASRIAASSAPAVASGRRSYPRAACIAVLLAGANRHGDALADARAALADGRRCCDPTGVSSSNDYARRGSDGCAPLSVVRWRLPCRLTLRRLGGW
jgi:hypothetical protein